MYFLITSAFLPPSIRSDLLEFRYNKFSDSDSVQFDPVESGEKSNNASRVVLQISISFFNTTDERTYWAVPQDTRFKVFYLIDSFAPIQNMNILAVLTEN
jgi:hypothetical protein